MENVEVLHGDCLVLMKGMPDCSVDAVVTDPPYGLSFMGKKWDYDVPSVEVWAECLRVLKPGGHLLAFAGTRTQHRMAVRIEDAGFEIRDMIAWVYGSGFPKSLNLKGEWQGWGTALKPALEPITVARKPLISSCINVRDVVECQLRNKGVTGDIQWKPESARDAAKSKKTPNSDSIKRSEPSATSAKTAVENETQKTGLQTQRSSGTLGTNGIKQIPEGNESFREKLTETCENKLLRPTAESVSAAEKPSTTSLPLTTSTEGEHSTVNKSTEKSTPNCGVKDSHPDTESFAGIVTGLTGFMATVHISRDSDGRFLWPKGLPENVPGKPLTVAENVLEHGTGALNVGGCRVGDNAGWSYPNGRGGSGWHGRESLASNLSEPMESTKGRWPANLIHDGSEGVLELFPAKAGAAAPVKRGFDGDSNGIYGDFASKGDDGATFYGDTGSAARFFYCAKASKRDRDEGLEDELDRVLAMSNQAKAELARGNLHNGESGMDTGKVRKNHHPTVKPTALMRYLCRLVTPPNGTILDPFMGSGSTGKGAVLEGFRFIGIEREAEYVEIGRARIASSVIEASSKNKELTTN